MTADSIAMALGGRRARIEAVCAVFNQLDGPTDACTGDAACRVFRDLADHTGVASPTWCQKLLDAGVSRESIYGVREHGRTILEGIAVPSLLLAGRVVFLDRGLFELTPSSTDDATLVPALMGPCLDQSGAAIDIWAASPRTRQVGCLYGFASVVDERELFRPRISPELEIHPDVMSWLRAGRAGTLVVNWARAVWLLRDAGPLLAERVEQGQDIERRFFDAGLLSPTIVLRRSNLRSVACLAK